MAEIGGLKRKYGGSVESVLEKLARLESDLAGLEGNARNSEDLKARLSKLKTKLTEAAGKLSRSREKAAAEFERRLPAEMAEMGMARAEFTTRVDRLDSESESDAQWTLPGLSENGGDRVEFLISVNPGEDIRPDPDLGVVEGRLGHGFARVQVHESQRHPGGPQVHGQPRGRRLARSAQHVQQPQSLPVLEQDATGTV